MKRTIALLTAISIIGGVLAACGPSQAALDATATQAAMNDFATQTALAPTATATFTPTPVPTATPTRTPTPTNTPTVTPTLTPFLMALAPTLEDLPVGFIQMPPDLFGEALQSMPEGSGFFEFVSDTQILMGVLIPVADQTEAAVYDASMEQLIEVFPAVLGAGPDLEDISGLDEIGESRAGISSTGPMMVMTMRWDTIGFRRGDVVAILIVGYPDGDEPLMSLADFSRLMDERIIAYQAANQL